MTAGHLMTAISLEITILLVVAILTDPVRLQDPEPAAKICSENGGTRIIPVRHSFRGGSSWAKIKFAYECNEAKTAITKCIPVGYELWSAGIPTNNLPPNCAPIAASSKPTTFCGEFGNMITVDCAAKEAPPFAIYRSFASQVCSTTEKAKTYKFGPNQSESIKITFSCKGKNNDEEFKSCKPAGRTSGINVGETGGFGGPGQNKYKLKCETYGEPTFPK